MNNFALGMVLALIGGASAIYADVPGQMKKIFDESVMAAQQVCSAGDLHSMSVMLDAKYLMDRRLPPEQEFEAWLKETFKENNVKELALDQWGNPYIYTVSGQGRSYRLRSAGPDGIPETGDDMVKSGP